jgi:hypothetical protein
MPESAMRRNGIDGISAASASSRKPMRNSSHIAFDSHLLHRTVSDFFI